MVARVDTLPVVVTCFAYKPEYVAELEGMLATLREHHPDWPAVVGRGPIESFELPTLEVEWPGAKCNWSLPVPLNLDSSNDDWRKICRMKAWWIARVWHTFGDLADSKCKRVLWIDADARLNSPLDIALDPHRECLAVPWWYEAEPEEDDPRTEGPSPGLMLLQGTPGSKVEAIIDKWSERCLAQIANLPPQTLSWPDSDQEVFTAVLESYPHSDEVLLKLDNEKYGDYIAYYGVTRPRSIVTHWLMSAKMWRTDDTQWPPAESYRRQVSARPAFNQNDTDKAASVDEERLSEPDA